MAPCIDHAPLRHPVPVPPGRPSAPPWSPPRARSAADEDEAALVQRARAGDADAFTALVQRYQAQIYAFIYRMMGNPDDADDLMQECFVKAYQALPRTSHDLRLAPWLHRIAVNTCLDVLRRRQRIRWIRWDQQKHDPLLLSAPLDEPERSALSQETRVTVQQVLDRMSHRHRRALILREYDGLSCAEIGAVLGISRSAVKSMLFRARQEFRNVAAAVPGVA